MGLTESKKSQAVGALRKCAKEHEKDFTPTFNIRVSDLCSDVADYLEELQKENEELKAFESHWEEIEEDAKVIAKENEELNRDKTELVNSVTELKNKVAELENQNKKLKCCGNCCYATNSNIDGTFCNRKAEYTHANHTCEDWS